MRQLERVQPMWPPGEPVLRRLLCARAYQHRIRCGGLRPSQVRGAMLGNLRGRLLREVLTGLSVQWPKAIRAPPWLQAERGLVSAQAWGRLP